MDNLLPCPFYGNIYECLNEECYEQLAKGNKIVCPYCYNNNVVATALGEGDCVEDLGCLGLVCRRDWVNNELTEEGKAIIEEYKNQYIKRRQYL